MAAAAGCSVAPGGVSSGSRPDAPVDRPNVVLIVADDLGWADLGVYGSRFHETPNLDRLAAQGMLFTNAYAAGPVCSPTRTSLMTGRYPARVRQTDWIPGNPDQAERPLLQVEDLNHLPLHEVTIAERLREAGYATAHIGKWHLGDDGHLPTDQGFQLNVAGSHIGHPPSYFDPYRKGGEGLEHMPGPGRAGEYLTDRLSDEASRFIEANRDRPFFLYFPEYAVHTPIEAPQELVAKYRAKAATMGVRDTVIGGPRPDVVVRAAQTNPVYAAMMEKLDQSVGRVLAALERNGVASRTIVIFTSDNGGLSTLPTQRPLGPTSNLPLRAGKGWLYEGGIRVPLLVRWPGQVTAGRVSDLPVTTPDLFATLVEVSRAGPPAGTAVDGIDLSPMLRGGPAPRRDAIFWHYPHYHGSGSVPSAAVREGDWKLIEWYETGAVELYDLRADPGERSDLASARPEIRDRLRQRLSDWRRSVDAQMPVRRTPGTGGSRPPPTRSPA